MDNTILNTLQETIRSTEFIAPEAIIVLLALSVLTAELFNRNSHRKYLFPVLVIAGLMVCAVLLVRQSASVIHNHDVFSFHGMLHLDGLAVIFKFIFVAGGLLFAALSLIGSKSRKNKSEAEYYIIFSGILLGSMLMVMASNLLMIYISIELVSISSYLLTPFNFDRKSAESGIKYVLYGAVASAIMLFGISLLYGFTQSLDIFSGDFIARLSAIPALPRFVALMMLISGFLFKMAVVPFHIWTPDIYEGAPIPLIAFFSVVPKLAGLIVFARTFFLLNIPGSEIHWRLVFGTLAIITMFTGNLAALRQTDAKRMMGYSSIAHSGYLMTGVLAASAWGLQSVVVHATVYLLMNFLVFMTLEIYDPVVNGTGFSNFKGQFRNSPAFASLMLIGFISLIGIPPTGGFTSKFLLFSSAWDSYGNSSDPVLAWLVVAGVLNSLISLFYYLRIPYYMAFREPETEMQKIRITRPVFLGLGGFLALVIIIVFLRPDGLVHILNSFNFVFRGMAQ